MKYGWLLLCMVSVADAQPRDTLIAEARVLASFGEARALAIDGAGILYVVDAAKDVVVQLHGNGEVVTSLGGSGAEDGQFDDPSDMDPTNGLLWVVADTGNSRLQRFSHTFLHMETLPVARIEHFTPGVAGRLEPVSNEVQSSADGRPIAVAVSSSNETFAIDEVQGSVLKWDASRRLERTIGGYNAGVGALVDPVALAVDARSLYVADRGRAAVFTYDHFGGFVRSLASGRADSVQALTIVDEALWVVLPRHILVYERGERLVQVIQVQLEETLVDAVRNKEIIYLLTPTKLLQADA